MIGALGPLRLPADDAGQGTRQYLLDGHQRMATLFAALGPGLYAGDEHETTRLGDDDEERALRQIYLDLEAEEQPFLLARRRDALPPTFVPLDRLLDPFGLRELEDTLQAHRPERKLVDRLQSVAKRFRDYVVPVMPIATEDLAQVTACFTSINVSGSLVSQAHMVHALLRGSSVDLLDMLDDLATALQGAGWEDLDQQVIFDICKTRLGLSPYEEDAEAIAERIRRSPDVLEQVQYEILETAFVLDRIANVRGPACLPYQQQAVLLADVVLDVHASSGKLYGVLWQWFWSTTLTEYFKGITRSGLERARRHLHQVVAGRAHPLPPDLPRTVEPIRRFDFRGARSRAVGLLLAELNPVDPFKDGKFNAFDLLAQHGGGALSRLARDREVAKGAGGRADGPENRFLVAPQRAMSLWKTIMGPELVLDAASLASHAIPPAAEDAIRKRDWSELLTHRRAVIEDLERRRTEECGLEYQRAK
jgi:hypothetical protein